MGPFLFTAREHGFEWNPGTVPAGPRHGVRRAGARVRGGYDGGRGGAARAARSLPGRDCGARPPGDGRAPARLHAEGAAPQHHGAGAGDRPCGHPDRDCERRGRGARPGGEPAPGRRPGPGRQAERIGRGRDERAAQCDPGPRIASLSIRKHGRVGPGEIGDDLAYYLARSEQIPSAVGIGVFVRADGSVEAAGATSSSFMPGVSDEQAAGDREHIRSLPHPTTMLRAGESPERILTASSRTGTTSWPKPPYASIVRARGAGSAGAGAPGRRGARRCARRAPRPGTASLSRVLQDDLSVHRRRDRGADPRGPASTDEKLAPSRRKTQVVSPNHLRTVLTTAR